MCSKPDLALYGARGASRLDPQLLEDLQRQSRAAPRAVCSCMALYGARGAARGRPLAGPGKPWQALAGPGRLRQALAVNAVNSPFAEFRGIDLYVF